MKIALLYPGIVLDGFAKNGIKPKTGWAHQGLCYISSALKEKGHDVSLIDLRQLSEWEELPQVIRNIMPDVLGITMLTLDFDISIKAAKIAKRVNSNIKIIVGGAHPTLMAKDLIDKQCIDYIFQGEAEETLPKIIEDIGSGNIKNKVIRGEIPDLDRIPFQDRFLFKILEVPNVPFLKMPFVSAIAGRGCPYNCSFCQPAERAIFSSKIRRVSVERFIDELEFVRRYLGLNTLMLHDDCFAADKRWAEKFMKLYSKKRFNKSIVCSSRADIIVKNPKIFKDMKKCGLQLLMVGFESGSDRVLKFIRKGTTLDINLKAASICKKLGIRILANLMLGIPTETNEEALASSRMIKKMNPYVVSPAFYVPNPGSDLYKYCVEHDLSLVKNYADQKRNPTDAKIKGIDYSFLLKILKDIQQIPFSVRMRRKFDKLKLGHFNKDLIANYNPV